MTSAAPEERRGFFQTPAGVYINTALAVGGFAVGAVDVAQGVNVLNGLGMAFAAGSVPFTAADVNEVLNGRDEEEFRQVNASFGAMLALQHAHLQPDIDALMYLAGQRDGIPRKPVDLTDENTAHPAYLEGFWDAHAAAVFFRDNGASGAAEGYADQVQRSAEALLASPPAAAGQVRETLDLGVRANLYFAAYEALRGRQMDRLLEALDGSVAAVIRADAARILLVDSLITAEAAGAQPAKLLHQALSMGALPELHPSRELADRIESQVQVGREAGLYPAPELPPWLPQPPAADGDAPYLRKTLREEAALIRTRVESLTRDGETKPEAWVAELGPCPISGSERAAWVNAVSHTAAYREQYGISREDALDGPTKAGKPTVHSHRQNVARRVCESSIRAVRPTAERASARVARLLEQERADMTLDVGRDEPALEVGRRLWL